MSNIFRKVRLSGWLAAIALLCAASPTLAQSTEDLARARQLADIAFVYAQAGESDRAIALLEQAETYTSEGCFEAIPWLKIGVAYQAVGEQNRGEFFLTQAADSAIERTLEDCDVNAVSPAEAFLDRAVEYAALGYLDLAMQVANRVDDLFKPVQLTEIAITYAKANRQAEAEEILAQALIDHQQLLARTIEDSSYVTPLLSDRMPMFIARQLVEADQPDLANFVVEESKLLQDLSEPDNILDDEYWLERSLSMAGFLVEIEQSQQALPLLDLVESNLQPISNPYTLYQWVEAARLYSKLDSNRSETLFEEVEANLSQLPASQIAYAKVTLTRGYANADKFEEALATANSIDETSKRQKANWAIAIAYAKARRPEDANALIQADSLRFFRISLMHTYLKTGQYSQAEKIARQPDMTDFLAEVGRTYCNMGLPESVLPLIELSSSADQLRRCAAVAFAQQGEFDRGLALAQMIADPEDQAAALRAIALQVQIQTKGADATKAVEILDRALGLIQSEIAEDGGDSIHRLSPL